MVLENLKLRPEGFGSARNPTFNRDPSQSPDHHIGLSHSCAIKSANPGSSAISKRSSDVKCARS